jgi:hypothetical protein
VSRKRKRKRSSKPKYTREVQTITRTCLSLAADTSGQWATCSGRDDVQELTVSLNKHTNKARWYRELDYFQLSVQPSIKLFAIEQWPIRTLIGALHPSLPFKVVHVQCGRLVNHELCPRPRDQASNDGFIGRSCEITFKQTNNQFTMLT